MPPSIVITEPVPRWRAWAQYTLKAGGLLLLVVVSFYAGVRYERHTPAVAAPTVAITQDGVPSEAPAPGATPAPVVVPAPAQPEVLAALSLEGLQVQSLSITRDPTVAGQFRYDFEVLNDGRLFEGSFELLVLGVQDGQPTQWVFPAEGQRGSGIFRLRVARYLKTEGRFQPPAGFTAQAVALRLRETAGVRASRGLALGEAPAR